MMKDFDACCGGKAAPIDEVSWGRILGDGVGTRFFLMFGYIGSRLFTLSNCSWSRQPSKVTT
jgi:hypothetical protein